MGSNEGIDAFNIHDAKQLLHALASMQMLSQKLQQQFPGDAWLQKIQDLDLLKLTERALQLSGNDYMPDPRDELPNIQVIQHPVDYKSQCTFCLEEYDAGNMVKQLPCQHIFHSPCLSAWLKSHNTCPLCRRTVKDWEDLRTELDDIHAQAISLILQVLQFASVD